MSYGLAEAIRLLARGQAPHHRRLRGKISDKIGTVRTSRMIFAMAQRPW